jgi:hypothetical protein
MPGVSCFPKTHKGKRMRADKNIFFECAINSVGVLSSVNASAILLLIIIFERYGEVEGDRSFNGEN